MEMMIQAAQACAPGGSGTKRDAVATLRMCMELLELMKLVSRLLPNHQVNTAHCYVGYRESSIADVATFFDSDLRPIRTEGF